MIPLEVIVSICSSVNLQFSHEPSCGLMRARTSLKSQTVTSMKS